MSSIQELSDAGQGSIVHLYYFNTDLQTELRLSEMGLIGSTPIHIIKNDGKGPIIIEYRHSKIILGRKISQKILIRG